MSDEREQALVRALVDDLTPVTPVARLRVALGWTLVVGAGLAAAELWRSGVRSDLPGLFGHSPGFGVVLAGLVSIAVGGLLAGLAGTRPDREADVRSGLWLAGIGGGLGLALGPPLLASDGGAAPPLADVLCVLRACLLALPAAFVAALFLARALARPRGSILLPIGLGAVAIGAVMVHLTCESGAIRHVVLAHAAGPLLGALLLWLPLRGLLGLLQSTSR